MTEETLMACEFYHGRGHHPFRHGKHLSGEKNNGKSTLATKQVTVLLVTSSPSSTKCFTNKAPFCSISLRMTETSWQNNFGSTIWVEIENQLRGQTCAHCDTSEKYTRGLSTSTGPDLVVPTADTVLTDGRTDGEKKVRFQKNDLLVRTDPNWTDIS